MVPFLLQIPICSLAKMENLAGIPSAIEDLLDGDISECEYCDDNEEETFTLPVFYVDEDGVAGDIEDGVTGDVEDGVARDVEGGVARDVVADEPVPNLEPMPMEEESRAGPSAPAAIQNIRQPFNVKARVMAAS